MTASYRTVATADTYRPDGADLLELKRRMIGIDEKQLKLLVGLLANGFWQCVVELPKVGGRLGIQRQG